MASDQASLPVWAAAVDQLCDEIAEVGMLAGLITEEQLEHLERLLAQLPDGDDVREEILNGADVAEF